MNRHRLLGRQEPYRWATPAHGTHHPRFAGWCQWERRDSNPQCFSVDALQAPCFNQFAYTPMTGRHLTANHDVPHPRTFGGVGATWWAGRARCDGRMAPPALRTRDLTWVRPLVRMLVHCVVLKQCPNFRGLLLVHLPWEGCRTDGRARTCNRRFWRPLRYQLRHVRSGVASLASLFGQQETGPPVLVAP